VSDPLDVDVRRALQEARMDVRDALRISNIRSHDLNRWTYRVRLTSGRTVKARRLEDEHTATRLVHNRSSLPEAFAPVTARYANVVFEEWIEGEWQGETSPDQSLLADAGRLLASLHQIVPRDAKAPRPRTSTAVFRDAATHAVIQLAQSGLVTGDDASQVALLIEQLDPNQAQVGLIHTW
jgi:hypothetical protein